jgi:hypothetical protein
MPHFFKQSLRLIWLGIDELTSALQVDRQADEVLLQAVVKLLFESATISIGGQDEAIPRSPQLLDLELEAVERFLQNLDFSGFQGDALLDDVRKLSVITPMASNLGFPTAPTDPGGA